MRKQLYAMYCLAAMMLSIILAGCSHTSSSKAFEHIQEAAKQRSGFAPEWHRLNNQQKEARAEHIAQILSSELTVETAVQVALHENAKLQAHFEKLQASEAEVLQALLLSNPVLDAEVRFPPSHGTNVEFSIVQNILRLTQLPSRRKIAEADFAKIQSEVLDDTLRHIQEVHKAYFTYQYQEQLLELELTVLQAFDASRMLAKKLRDAGNISQLELAEEQAAYAEQYTDYLAHQLTTLKKREALQQVLGLPKEASDWTISKRLPEQLRSDFPNNIVEHALQANLQLAAMQSELAAARGGLEITKSSMGLDEIELGISGSKEGDWGFGPAVHIPIPIFDFGQGKRLRNEAQLFRLQATAKALSRKIGNEAVSLAARLEVARKRAEHVKTSLLPLRAKVLDESQKHYNAMFIGAFQLLAAKRAHIKAGKIYLETLHDYWWLHTQMSALLRGTTLTENWGAE